MWTKTLSWQVSLARNNICVSGTAKLHHIQNIILGHMIGNSSWWFWFWKVRKVEYSQGRIIRRTNFKPANSRLEPESSRLQVLKSNTWWNSGYLQAYTVFKQLSIKKLVRGPRLHCNGKSIYFRLLAPSFQIVLHLRPQRRIHNNIIISL